MHALASVPTPKDRSMETEGFILVVVTIYNQAVNLTATLNLWIYMKKLGKSRAGNGSHAD
jgi:hypothetical protein